MARNFSSHLSKKFKKLQQGQMQRDPHSNVSLSTYGKPKIKKNLESSQRSN
jgi:hypothetical protein